MVQGTPQTAALLEKQNLCIEIQSVALLEMQHMRIETDLLRHSCNKECAGMLALQTSEVMLCTE